MCRAVNLTEILLEKLGLQINASGASGLEVLAKSKAKQPV